LQVEREPGHPEHARAISVSDNKPGHIVYQVPPGGDFPTRTVLAPVLLRSQWSRRTRVSGGFQLDYLAWIANSSLTQDFA
jgi:hypothetical protein